MTMEDIEILILDDESVWLNRHRQQLSEKFQCHATQIAETAIEIVNSSPNLQVVIVDEVLYIPHDSGVIGQIPGENFELQRYQGSGVVRVISENRPDIKFIFITSAPLNNSRDDSNVDILVNRYSELTKLPSVIDVIHKFTIEANPSNVYDNLISRLDSLISSIPINFIESGRAFLKAIEAEFETKKRESFIITSVKGAFQKFLPVPVWFAQLPNETTVNSVIESIEPYDYTQRRCGIIIHQHLVDTATRCEIGKVRIRKQFSVALLSASQIEAALRSNSCKALLNKLADDYVLNNNLFDYRNAISDVSLFFGRTTLLEKLQEKLINNQSIGLFGIRKIGKTSMLIQLMHILQGRQHPVVHIDLQVVSKPFYGAKLFRNILDQLFLSLSQKNPESIDEHQAIFNKFLNTENLPAKTYVNDFTAVFNVLIPIFLNENFGLPIIIFFDEIENILPRPGDSKENFEEFNDFFGCLRALSQTNNYLSIVAVDVRADCNRINYWECSDIRTNPLFHFFQEQFLFGFTQDETCQMLRDIAVMMGYQDQDVIFNDNTFRKIHEECGGHPYLSRQVASLIHQSLLSNYPHITGLGIQETFWEELIIQGELIRNYFHNSIWAEMSKSGHIHAISILKFLSCCEGSSFSTDIEVITEKIGEISELECLETVQWLQNIGIIRDFNVDGKSCYAIQIPLLARWIWKKMNRQERAQWHH